MGPALLAGDAGAGTTALAPRLEGHEVPTVGPSSCPWTRSPDPAGIGEESRVPEPDPRLDVRRDGARAGARGSRLRRRGESGRLGAAPAPRAG